MKKFLTGLAAGVAIGYLTAPRAGKDTRQQLSQSAGKQTDGLKSQWETIVTQGNQLLNTVLANLGVGQSDAKSYGNQATKKADQIADKAKTATEGAKVVYNDNVDDAADAAETGVNKAAAVLTV